MSSIRVDFYLLDDKETQTIWHVACRLLEKAYQRGHRVFVYCDSQEDAEHLDELLWTYKDDSFIPHNLQGEGPEPPPAVQIGFSSEPRGYNDILLNMSKNTQPWITRFRRVMEIVSADDTAKEISRNHYRDYRSKKYTIHTHPLKTTNGEICPPCPEPPAR